MNLAHTTDKQKEQMSPEIRQIAYANAKADEFAEFSEVLAKGALERGRENCELPDPKAVQRLLPVMCAWENSAYSVNVWRN